MGFLEITYKCFGDLIDLLMSCFLNTSSHHDDGNGDTDQTTRASSSSTPPSRQNYEVFLSFRGEDTRRSFTSHLYYKLVDRGILTFRDNEELRVGERITQLFEAIKASKISIPIISPDYASSLWCLKELLQMLECMKTSGQLVLPIFYHVKPSDIREQKGDFGKKFHQCKRKYGKLVPELEKAFIEVTSLKGLESEKIADEGELVERVVARIFLELRKAVLDVPDFLVGVEDHVEQIKEMIGKCSSNNAKIIGIHGMGGVGKTTLAKVLYNVLCKDFERHSFVPNIREASKIKGMEALQEQIITNILGDKSLQKISHVDEGKNIIEKSFKGKRLLLLLDDIEDKDDVNKLAVKENLFGAESIIIITTRNKDVISKVNLSYELDGLNYDQSYELFCKHAFGRDASCPRGLKTIARSIILTAGGLPLALEIIGSYLCGEDEDIWKETLKKLWRIPHEKVRDKLKISYDSLEYDQQQIFLDIACLNLRGELESAPCMWERCGFYPKGGIKKLISLSLIKIEVESHEIIMHDQLRDLGREIVQAEDHNNIWLRSRIHLEDEAIEAIERKQGASNVQALVIDQPCIRCTSQHFEGLTNLRFLRLDNVCLTGDFENHLLNLRWFQWLHYPPVRYLELDIMGINFNPKRLVVLHLHIVNITEHWKGWGQMKYLKVLRLVYCYEITTTPDFSAWELEVLVIRSCSNFRNIHPSIGKLNKTLKVLDVSWCEKLEELPIEVGTMEELKTLSIDYTGIREIPIFKGCMAKLETLSATYCKQLTHISDSLGSLAKLQCLKLGHSTSLTKIPESIGELCNLESLDIANTLIKCLPTSIGKLSKLPGLDLTFCKELEFLPNLPSSLTSLHFNGELIGTLPDFSNLTNLNELNYFDLFEKRNRAVNLGNLNQLKTLRISHKNYIYSSMGFVIEEEIEIHTTPEHFSLQLELPISLVELHVSGCKTLHTLPNLSILKNLSRLRLVDCSELMEIDGLEGAELLTDLKIERCRKLSRLGDLSHLKMLRTLQLNECFELMETNGLEGAELLTNLEIGRCKKLSKLGDLSHLKMLSMLTLCDCEKLSDVQGIEKSTSLTDLFFSRCHPEINFPNLSMLGNLKRLRINYEGLMEITGLQALKSLEYLDISGCKSLQYLPNLSTFTNLKKLRVDYCKKLIDILGLENLTSLRELHLIRCIGCTAPEKIPDLPDVHVTYISIFQTHLRRKNELKVNQNTQDGKRRKLK